MKRLVMTFGMLIAVILVTLSIMSINSKHVRQEEVEYALGVAADHAMEKVLDRQVVSNEEMVEIFLQELLNEVESNGDVTIKVYSVDYKNGLLDVAVTQNFKYPNGNNGSVTCRKSIVEVDV